MTTYEILTFVISSLLLLSAMFGVYLKLKIDITKTDMKIKSIERELLQKEISSLLSEKINREDHIKIIEKIDKLIEIYTNK